MIGAMISRAVQSLRHQKLSQDIAYSLGSFFVLAVSGIVINIAITALRDAAALGVFNLSYAVYIVASQFAVFGLHYSVLRYSAYHEASEQERGTLLCTASLAALLLGVLAALIVHSAEPLFARAFGSEVTARAVSNAAWGLALFPLNKVLLAYLNGLRRMKAYSVLQGVRYFVVMLLVAIIAASARPIEDAAFCFLIAEVITAVLAIGYLISRRLIRRPRVTVEWMRRHFSFGARGLMAGMFSEINSRIDVLMIGFFLTDRAVGIYSFAAMLVDGLYQVLAIVRINFNPMLVSAIRDKQWDQARHLRVLAQKIVLPVALFLALGLVLAYYAVTAWVMPEKGMLEGLPSLVILLAGLVLVSHLVPFDNLMMVSGHPGYQTTQQLCTVGANILIAAILLPVLGIEGAAIGTAVSYVTGIATLVFFANRVIGWQLLRNVFRY
ncbi:hypothetical protein D3870_00285 [Noviherbaspirillum cavernae]|uniref:Uncharacterized protein n=1 Tax=Noviherbaspirillum cavernae TaxID=2320862 RepID=A0A418WWQ4_9BURK|nr:oligosaccharide flippase family protein [Noviherbaspirillum cavernae]RJG04664.1 hypothetical protein D3870_00285 [Noviherbaspirillum cavernae]